MIKLNELDQSKIINQIHSQLSSRPRQPQEPANESLNLSQQGELIREFQQQISHSPDIRQERIARISQEIDKGRYHTDLDRIVDILMSSDINSKI